MKSPEKPYLIVKVENLQPEVWHQPTLDKAISFAAKLTIELSNDYTLAKAQKELKRNGSILLNVGSTTISIVQTEN